MMQASDWIALAAVCIACASVWMAWQQNAANKLYYKATIEPAIVITTNEFNDSNGIINNVGIYISNRGMGPAKIERIEMRFPFNGEMIKERLSNAVFDKLLGHIDNYKNIFRLTTFKKDSFLAPGAYVPLCATRSEKFLLKQIFGDLTIFIHYRTLLNEQRTCEWKLEGES